MCARHGKRFYFETKHTWHQRFDGHGHRCSFCDSRDNDDANTKHNNGYGNHTNGSNTNDSNGYGNDSILQAPETRRATTTNEGNIAKGKHKETTNNSQGE
mmetsp:Transcript_14181/g.29582  ORF Transcript_14181/g.29582 Transcript_14181/m.29582 type:complete len:100 (+) Transcript_14181:181-480(+)